MTATHYRYEPTAADADAVRQIIGSTEFFRPDEVAVAVELVDERRNRGPASGYFFVFVDTDEGLAGYACYGPIACTLHSYDLYWIAVDPEFQRRGLGRQLLAESERLIAALGGQRVYIETSDRPLYLPTRRFYKQNGYTLAAQLPEFYGPEDGKLVYVKVLPAFEAASIS